MISIQTHPGILHSMTGKQINQKLYLIGRGGVVFYILTGEVVKSLHHLKKSSGLSMVMMLGQMRNKKMAIPSTYLLLLDVQTMCMCDVCGFGCSHNATQTITNCSMIQNLMPSEALGTRVPLNAVVMSL